MIFRRGDDLEPAGTAALRHAAWVARCVGRGADTHLAAADLEVLAGELSTVAFARGDVVFAAGRPAAGVCIVRAGSIGLFAGSGADRVILSILRPGDLDGDAAMLLDMAPAYSAEALEDSVCLWLERESFLRLFGRHPELARRWMSAIAGRLAMSQQRLADLLGRPLGQQVARVILDEAVDGRLPYSQATIAALLGARRPSVNKVLGDLQQRGVIEIAYRSITVLDVVALGAAAGRAIDGRAR